MRGTEYSEKHITFNKNDIAFWNFTVDDISIYDVPAQLTYISKVKSSNEKIIYIGHSLGSTAALIYGATLPQNAQNLVKLFILLAPNGGIKNTKSIFLRISSLIMDSIVNLYINTEIAKSLANNGIVDTLSTSICLKTPKLMKTCLNMLNIFFMGPQTLTDASVVPILFNLFPSGTGLRVLNQIAESTRSGFKAYDFKLKNLEKYGSSHPPTYDVYNIKVPIYMVHSHGDWCVTKTDSEILYNKLSPESKVYGKLEILDKEFNHNDFIFGKTAKSVLYDKLIQLMNKTT